ncbi:MAG: hypothetical protein HYW34_01255, partial [Candidatus Brennerbacteria bacterium]|nr:hypothetical protein [Candidatus Brennerbacteria bacterium]
MGLLFLRNKETNIAQDPKGENIIVYLRSQFGFKSSWPVNQRIDELARLGYIEKHCYNGQSLFSVKLLKIRWCEPEPAKKLKSKPVKKEKFIKIEKILAEKIVQKEGSVQETNATAAPVVQQKRFGILIDYENLKRHVSTAKLLNFDWLFEPILNQGKIVGGYVFFPEHYGTNMPVKTLSNIHRLFCIVCPKDIKNNGTVKDKDTVDSR